MAFRRYGQGDVCFCNVAWIVFPVYIVMLWVYSSMGNEMFFFYNDNDNDNEIIFIAKWHTDHVQRTWVKNRSGRNDIHEIYKTWQRGLEAIVAYVPQYQLYQADCLGSAEQKQCWVLELFQYKTRSFMRMYTHIYTSYGKHVHIHVHVYTSIHREGIITIDASMY